MAARTARLSKPDKQGQYARQLGWKLNSKGTRVQHKFRLGTDKREAERRDDRLRQLWEKIDGDAPDGTALWDEVTLEIGKQLARGADKVHLVPVPDDEAPTSYATRLQRIQNRFSFLRFVPTDEKRYTIGIGDNAIDMRQVVLVDNPYEDYWRKHDVFAAPPLKANIGDVTVGKGDLLDSMINPPYRTMTDDGKTLHQAFAAYEDWIKQHYFDDETQTLSEYAHTKLGQIDSLKDRHEDVPLAEIDYDYIEKMYRFWRQRPMKRTRKGQKEQRMSASSVRHYVGELHRFFKWLHRSKDFAWRKPEDIDDIDRSTRLDTETVKQRIRKVDTFQLDELRLLNRYATPTERLYLMLGLNCGFGTKEIATLTIGEIFLHQALPADEQEVFGFHSTDDDSFVSLVRNKTTIVGKYLLFGQTVKMLEWVMARRLKQRNPSPDQPAILNSKGMPLDQRSANGNPSRQIPNTFSRLHKRIIDDGNEITKLPFKHLRKTAGDLIRRFSDGEVAGVFLLHGSPVTTDKLSDVYTNRPFGKVYDAIRRVEEYLQPVFEEAGDDPTLEQPQAYTSRKSVDRIAEMTKEGKTVREIAEAIGKSRMTVHRHIQKLRERGLLDA